MRPSPAFPGSATHRALHTKPMKAMAMPAKPHLRPVSAQLSTPRQCCGTARSNFGITECQSWIGLESIPFLAWSLSRGDCLWHCRRPPTSRNGDRLCHHLPPAVSPTPQISVWSYQRMVIEKTSLHEFEIREGLMSATSSYGEEMVGNQGPLPDHDMAAHFSTETRCALLNKQMKP
jgi:hypothetical protein